MPLYEYQCQQCNRRVEKIQKFSDAPLTTCPHCGGTLERTLTAPAIQFKGSGWYKDLYSSPKPAGTAGNSAGEAASGSSTEASSTGGKTDIAASASPAPAPSAPSTAPASPAGSTKS